MTATMTIMEIAIVIKMARKITVVITIIIRIKIIIVIILKATVPIIAIIIITIKESNLIFFFSPQTDVAKI